MNMNLEKARDHFSAYYEKTLEKGLLEAFERALKTDAQVQAEYRAFERLMGDLEVLKTPVPEPGEDLHELISRRLDLHIHEQKRRAPGSLFGWWKSLALGGLATAALVLAVLQIQSAPKNGSVGASLVPSVASEKLELKPYQNGFRLEYAATGRKSITIRTIDGVVLEEKTIQSGSLLSPLANQNPNAKLLQVEVSGEKPVVVAVPGTRIQTEMTGEGTVKDLALAVAGFYRQPVMLTLGDEIKLKWEFREGEAIASIDKALAETNYSAQQNESGVIVVQPN